MIWAAYAFLYILTRTVETIYTKKILSNQHPLVFSFWRSFFGLVFILSIAVFLDLDIGLGNVYLVFLISVLGTMGILYRNISYKMLDLSYVTPMLNITPLLVFVSAVMFLGETLSIQKVTGVLLVVSGTYLLNRGGGESPLKRFVKEKKYVILVPITLFTATALLDKVAMGKINPLAFIFYLSIFLTTQYLGLLMCEKKITATIKSFKAHTISYPAIGLLLFTSQIGQYYATSLQRISLVTPLLSTTTLFVVLLSGKIFEEKNIKDRLMSSLAVISGIALIVS